MKSSFVLMLLIGLFAVSSHAQKPERIQLTIKVPIILKGNNLTNPDIIHGENGVSCAIYNYVGHDVTLEAGQKIILHAAYWDGEASWSEDIERHSITCYGDGIVTRLTSAASLPDASFEAMREGMKNVFTVEVR